MGFLGFGQPEKPYSSKKMHAVCLPTAGEKNTGEPLWEEKKVGTSKLTQRQRPQSWASSGFFAEITY
jgi:hypothetical protein